MGWLLGPRMGRGNFAFGVLALALIWVAAQWFLAGRLSLLLQLGLKSGEWAINAPTHSLTPLAAILDAALVWFVVRRLRDIGTPGKFAVLLAVLPFLGGVGAILTLAGVAVLVAWPGQIGPNRFGRDPRGWHSREQYDEQQRRLKAGEV